MRIVSPTTVLFLPLVAVLVLALVAPDPVGGGSRQAVVADQDEADGPADPAGCWHRVAPGESLRSIARRYYGSARFWRTVQVANDVGMTPDPGHRLWVPGRFPELP